MSNFDVRTMNLFEKMMKISEEAKPIQRDLSVEAGNGKTYFALSEKAVLETIKPLEHKYRVYSYPAKRVRTAQTLRREYVRDGQSHVITLLVDRIDVVYRFVNVDAPSEYIEVDSFGTGIDTNDKGPGKAMTYADKYAIMKAYKLSAEDAADDPDATGSPAEGFFTDELSELAVPSAPGYPVMDQGTVSSGGLGNVWMPPGVQPVSAAPAARRPRPTKIQRTGPEPEGPPEQEPNSGVASEDSGMTLEKARAFVVPIGTDKGKRLGEVLAVNRRMVEFYAGDKFRNEKYPDLKQAARCLLQSMG